MSAPIISGLVPARPREMTAEPNCSTCPIPAHGIRSTVGLLVARRLAYSLRY
jgi:hypothetical protein